VFLLFVNNFKCNFNLYFNRNFVSIAISIFNFKSEISNLKFLKNCGLLPCTEDAKD